MKILKLELIRDVLHDLDLVPLIEQGFAAYSDSRAVVPPVGELLLEKGEVHIKYGFIRQQRFYVIKIASGFYDNPKLGMPSGDGMMLLFLQETGQPVAALLDAGLLTNVRTAIAGTIGARYLAPKEIRRIGVFGTGTQARLQVQYLQPYTECRELFAWGRSRQSLQRYANEMSALGFSVSTSEDPDEVGAACNLLITTTPSKTPLMQAESIRPGTHINAIGSDVSDKQELPTKLVANADLLVADSRAQCSSRGEISHALREELVQLETIPEIGELILGRADGRTGEDQITIFDSTGVAVQDIQIATAVANEAGI